MSLAGAGAVSATPPGRDPSVAFAATEAMRSPRGAAVVMSAVLPEGGYIVISLSGVPIGANPVALGRGQFNRMMIGIDPEVADGLEGPVELTAQLYKEFGDDPSGWVPYDTEPVTATVTF